MSPGEGERLEAERRGRFWKLVLMLAAVGAVAGFVFGFASGHASAIGRPLEQNVRIAAGCVLVLAAIAGLYGSWRFFAAVDEVELADNLWASLVGFYVYGFMFPTWWMLSWLEVAPEPNDWMIYAAAVGSATAAYVIRKWRSR